MDSSSAAAASILKFLLRNSISQNPSIARHSQKKAAEAAFFL